jgi:hypothetical protein
VDALAKFGFAGDLLKFYIFSLSSAYLLDTIVKNGVDVVVVPVPR